MAAVEAAILPDAELELEDILSRIADIRDAARFWAGIPEVMKMALDGRRNDDVARQLILQRVWPNFLLDQERIAAYMQYKDAIPSLGNPAPRWMNLLRNTVIPTADRRHRHKVREAINSLSAAYETALRSPQGLGTLEREVKRERKTSEDGRPRSDERRRRKPKRDRAKRSRTKGR